MFTWFLKSLRKISKGICRGLLTALVSLEHQSIATCSQSEWAGVFLLCELLFSPQRKPDDQQHNGVFPHGRAFRSLFVACCRGAQKKKSPSKQEWDVFRHCILFVHTHRSWLGFSSGLAGLHTFTHLFFFSKKGNNSDVHHTLEVLATKLIRRLLKVMIIAKMSGIASCWNTQKTF